MRLTIFGETGGTGQDLVPSLSDVKDTRGRGQVAGKTLLGPAHKPRRRSDPYREQALNRNSVSTQDTF